MIQGPTRKAVLLTLGVATLSCSLCFGQNGQRDYTPTFAVGGDFGTTGVGGSLWISASSRLVVTLGFDSLDMNQDYSTDGVDYDGNIDFSNGYALLRWHPMDGSFHLSTGAVKTDNSIRVVGRPQDGTTFDIDGVDYSATLVGSIVGDVQWEKSLVPYFGIGWAKQPQRRGWGSFLDIGVIQSGSPDADLTATGTIADDPTFQANLLAEEREINDELDKFELFPVARFGLLYRF